MKKNPLGCQARAIQLGSKGFKTLRVEKNIFSGPRWLFSCYSCHDFMMGSSWLIHVFKTDNWMSFAIKKGVPKKRYREIITEDSCKTLNIVRSELTSLTLTFLLNVSLQNEIYPAGRQRLENNTVSHWVWLSLSTISKTVDNTQFLNHWLTV